MTTATRVAYREWAGWMSGSSGTCMAFRFHAAIPDVSTGRRMVNPTLWAHFHEGTG
jgi:hypothetical protein